MADFKTAPTEKNSSFAGMIEALPGGDTVLIWVYLGGGALFVLLLLFALTRVFDGLTSRH